MIVCPALPTLRMEMCVCASARMCVCAVPSVAHCVCVCVCAPACPPHWECVLCDPGNAEQPVSSRTNRRRALVIHLPLPAPPSRRRRLLIGGTLCCVCSVTTWGQDSAGGLPQEVLGDKWRSRQRATMIHVLKSHNRSWKEFDLESSDTDF